MKEKYIMLCGTLNVNYTMSQELITLEHYDPYNEITLTNKTNPLEFWIIQITEKQGSITKIWIDLNNGIEILLLEIKRPDIYRRHKFIHEGKTTTMRLYEDGKKEVLSSGRYIPVCTFVGCCYATKLHNQMCASHKNGNMCLHKEATLIPKKKKEEMVNAIELSDRGSNIEEYVLKILKTFDFVSEIKWIAGVNSTFDILYKLQGESEFRGLQVKKLSLSSYEDNYNITQQKVSFDDLLYVCLNEEKTRFVLIYGKLVGKRGLTFSFYSKNTKYDKNMYRDYNLFLDAFKNEIKKSMFVSEKIFKESLTKEQLLEYESIERIEQICKNKNLNFERCSKAQEQYDIIINKKLIQCKYTTRSACNNVRFHLHKSDGDTPYSEKDNIDFVMLESGFDKGNFYIIPKSILVEKGYFSTNEQPGKTNLPTTNKALKINKEHWTDEYYNAFHLLQ
jgi:hypothetical protein